MADVTTSLGNVSGGKLAVDGSSDSGSRVAGEFEHLLAEIESTGGSCANVIRKLSELSTGSGAGAVVLADFMGRLDGGIAERDSEIERMCNHHYQGFVDSIRELLQVQQDAEQLRKRLGDISGGVTETIEQVRKRCEELGGVEDTSEHIEEGISGLQLCLPVLDTYARVERSMKAKRFYPALKSLEYLEHSQLPLIAPCSFADALAMQIPRMRANIKAASQSELTDFLANIRKHSVRLGAVAMKQTAEKTGMDCAALIGGYVKTAGQGAGRPNRHGVKKALINPFTGQVDAPDVLDKELEDLVMVPSDDEDDAEGVLGSGGNNVEDLVDFGAVYRCLHIHSVLGERVEFEKFYRTQRKKQCQLSLSLSRAQQESLRNYSEFFSGVVGFFVVEDYIRHTVPSMAQRNYLEEMWTKTMHQLVEITRTNAEKLTDTELLLRLKDFCVLFGRTMRSLGFNVAGLKDLSDEVWRRYQGLLQVEWEGRFQEIFSRDDYTAIYLTKTDDYQLILDMYPCQTPEFDVLGYPKSLSFSMMVPRIYQAVKEYIDICRQFTENLDLSQTEVEDMVNKATNILFSHTLNRCMTTAIRGSNTNLLRLIQLSVNMDELETACIKLEEHILFVVTGVQPGAGSDLVARQPQATQEVHQPPRSRLHGMSLFKDTRSEAENQIYATMNTKIDEFMELARYDWMAGEALSSPSKGASSIRPSDYIVDLMGYLDGTFRAFTNLPPKVAQASCVSSCKHIAFRINEMVLGPQVKMLTESVLAQVSQDVAECERFAMRDPVPGVDITMLLLTFRDLRQLMDIVLNDDWANFISSHGKQDERYDRVTPGSAIKILEKLRDADKKKSSIFESMKGQKRDKRKKIEDFLRQLRDIQTAAYGR